MAELPNPAARSRTSLVGSDWPSAVLIIGLALFVSWNTLGPVIDEDVWYHMAIGRWIVEHRSLPTHDVFAQPGDRPWTSYGPLWDSSIYLIHQAGGLVGIELYRWLTSVVAALLACLLFRGRLRDTPTAALLAWAVSAAALPVFQERSWMVSVLGFLLTLIAVDRIRQGDRRVLAWLPAAFVIWANWHIQVMFGLMILALAAAEDLATRALKGRGGIAPSTAGRPLDTVALAGACGLATLVHPMGWRLFPLALSFRAPVRLQHWIEELHPPDFTESTDWLVLGLLLAVVLAAAMRWRSPAPRRLPLMELALVVMGTQRFFHYRRDGWVLALSAGAALATLVGPVEVGRQVWRRIRASLVARVVAWGAVAVGMMRVVALAIAFPESQLEAAVESHFPVRAVAEVERRQLPGPLFNDFNWGGYLMFALNRLPVATDSRMDAHSESELELNILTWVGRAHDPALDRANLVIAQHFHGLPDALAADPGWERVYSDSVAQVFVRRAKN